MKRALLCILALLILLLAACNASTDYVQGTNGAAPATTAPSAAETTLPAELTVPARPLPKPEEAVLLAMKDAFAHLYGEAGNATADEVSIEAYFGCFGNNHVAFIGLPWLVYTEALWNEILMGLDFRYTDGQKLQVYRNGEMLTLSEAVENGWFTLEELQQLHAAYKASRDFLYEKETTQ